MSYEYDNCFYDIQSKFQCKNLEKFNSKSKNKMHKNELFIILKKNNTKVKKLFKNNIDIEKIIKELKKLYKEFKFKKKVFNYKPKNIKNLKFGFICPGALKTISYLEKKKNINSNLKQIIKDIKKYTDAMFFIEIIVIYKKYLTKKFINKANKIIDNNHCEMGNILSIKISELFGKLPFKIKSNLPDDFYHIRHRALICSNDEQIAEDRINLLKSIYDEKLNDLNVCKNKRDGVSGCRDCCKKYFKGSKYQRCVTHCMKF